MKINVVSMNNEAEFTNYVKIKRPTEKRDFKKSHIAKKSARKTYGEMRRETRGIYC